MIQINELRLRIPNINQEEALVISRLVSQQLAKHIPKGIVSGYIGQINLRIPDSGQNIPEVQASVISKAILSELKSKPAETVHPSSEIKNQPTENHNK